MILYTWDKFSKLAKECRLTEDQTAEIRKDVFVSEDKNAGFHDIARKLKDMMHLSAFVPDDFSGEWGGRHRDSILLAGLLIRMMEEERPGERPKNEEIPYRDLADSFVSEHNDIFDSSPLSVYVLEAAADLFKTSPQDQEGGEKENCLWLRQLFDRAGLYRNLLSCYTGMDQPVKERTDAFFLRLFLLYRTLDPYLENENGYDLRTTIFYIVTIITRPGTENRGETSESGGSDYGYDRRVNEEALSVLGDYVSYLPHRDIEMQLRMLPQRLSGKYNSMAARSADILIEKLSCGDPAKKTRFRILYIDAVVLKHLCETVSKELEGSGTESEPVYKIVPFEFKSGPAAVIQRADRTLIKIVSDNSKIIIEFRKGEELPRSTAESADWSKDDIRKAAEQCRIVLLTRSTFLFSYVYLEDYRTVGKMAVSFDHRYSMKDGKIQKAASGCDHSYFYGSHIYSLTCLVGRNGAGKSSIADFLRESFLAIKIDADKSRLKWNDDGSLSLDEEKLKRYHLMPRTKFFVIFTVEGEDRYLTNFPVSSVLISGIKDLYPYKPIDLYSSSAGSTSPEYNAGKEENRHGEGMKFTAEDCTFAYFSQFCYPAGMYFFQHIGEDQEYRGELEKYVRDLSEEYYVRRESWNYRASRGGLRVINERLLPQIVFLLMLLKKPDQVHLTMTGDERAHYKGLQVITNAAGNDPVWIRDIAEGTGNVKDSILLDILRDQDAFMAPFSSGQHSRINLLSRLYWCLAGGSAFVEAYGGKWPGLCGMVKEYEAALSCQNRLAAKDAGVLFFDEGDLCFHPEWQRTYLSDITRMVSGLRTQDVQIIVTTNSPFMLSDILRTDVYSLSGDQADIPGLDPSLQTYGQNIHMLLAHHFFLKSTVGKMSEETLIWLRNLLKEFYISQNQGDEEKARKGEEMMRNSLWKQYKDYLKIRFPELKDEENVETELSTIKIRDFLNDLIDSIGERVYRVTLKNELDRSFYKK